MTSLDKNTFYKSLLTRHKKKYSEATQRCHTICVPINGSYDLNAVNDKFISAHILKASPLLKSHFVVSNNKHNFDVEIDGQILRVTRGFGDNNCETINILSEEIAYNSHNNEFRILVIENPLINSSNRRLNYETKNNMSNNCSLITFKECETFLRNVSSDLTERLKSKVEKLMNTFTVSANNVEEVSELIKVIIDWAIQCFRALPSFPEITNNELCFESAIESYAIGLIHPKIVISINKLYERDDKILFEKFVELSKHSINAVQFGAQKAFESFTINSVIIDELSQLEQKTTPLEKLYCLRKTLDLVSEQLSKSAENMYFPLVPKSEPICIVSEDLIATLICVLTSVKPKRFESEINFINKFNYNLPQNNEFGYSLVTFEVCKEFIKNFNLSQISTKSTKTTKTAKKVEVKAPESPAISETIPMSSCAMSSPLDRELDKISKMIENSNIPSNNTKTMSNSKEVVEDLGEFLGALSQNNFTVGIGKQF